MFKKSNNQENANVSGITGANEDYLDNLISLSSEEIRNISNKNLISNMENKEEEKLSSDVKEILKEKSSTSTHVSYSNQTKEQTTQNIDEIDEKEDDDISEDTPKTPVNVSEAIIEETNDTKDPVEILESSLDDTNRAQVITVFSAKGGIGKTTIACSIAVELSKNRGKKVCIVDYNMNFGNVFSTLKFSNYQGKTLKEFSDLIELKGDEELTTQEILELLQYNDDLKLYSLVLPKSVEDRLNIKASVLAIIAQNIIYKGGFDYVIFDTANSLQNATIAALAYSDKLILVQSQDIRALYNNNEALDVILEKEFLPSRESIYTIINKLQGKDKLGISEQEINEKYGFIPLGTLVYEDIIKLMTNKGKSPMIESKKTKFKKEMIKIVDNLIEKE